MKDDRRYYVKRSSRTNPAGYSYVGPLTERRAQREVEAWKECEVQAQIIPATPEMRAEVKRWDKVTHAEDAKEIVFFQGEQMTFAAYRLHHEAA